MNDPIIQKADQVIAATYARFPIIIERGKGCTLWDTAGRQYIDFVAGIAVCNLGHSNSKLIEALIKQAEILWHVSNLYYTLPQTELAELLINKSFADRVFFANSGAEANEAAIKLARKYFQDKGENNRFRVIAMEQSFHGRTMATLSATGQPKLKLGFDPVLNGFDFVPFNDINALAAKVSSSTSAILIEPVQGEGGVRCPDSDYLKKVRKLCDETGTLLILDEIQTGMGRTGKLFGYEHFGIEPDIMTLAKALGNGLPIGAMLAKEFVAKAFGPGSHASTFGGTPLVTAAALKVLKIFDEENILEHCNDMGSYLKQELMRLKDKYDFIEDVRGMGLLLGIKMKFKARHLVQDCMEKGFLINCIQEKILRFVPPLIISKKEIDSLINCLDKIFAGLGKNQPEN